MSRKPNTPPAKPAPEHEHFTYSYAHGRRQAVWSTKDECVKCGTGREWR